MIDIIMGIDPGKLGGIAVRDVFAEKVWAIKMPETERDVWDFIRPIKADSDEIFAYIEHVHSMPGQGVSSMFKFGMNYGMLRAFLIAAGIPFEKVSPGVWQRGMRCLSGGDKNVTKARAQELFPELKIIHATADALLIMEYGRRKQKGETT